MTPSMNMAAPKGTQAPAAGLAAIAQPAQAPKGKSPENMGQIMSLARKMSDAQLADVLNGKSLDVPQFAAMTEAMGRKQLRNAVQGAQAMAQAKQPSLKDRLMAEQQAEAMPQMPQMPQIPQGMPQEPVMAAGGGLMYADGGSIDMNESADMGGGIAELPAPNMEPMTMAGGGIIAFDDGGDVEDSSIFPAPSGFDKKLWKSLKEKFNELNQPWGKTVEASPAEVRGALAGKNLKQDMGAPHPSAAPAPTPEQTAAFLGNLAPSAPTVVPGPTQEQRRAFYEKSKGTGIGVPPTPAVGERSQSEQDYLAKLAGLGEKTRGGIADIKNQTQSQIFLDAASALLGSRNLAEAGSKAGQLVAGRVGSMGKDMRSAEKEANEYDLNLAKSRAALEAGDKDRAFKYQQAADENRYRMAMVNKPDSGIALLNALGDPKMMERYKEMQSAKKPTETVPRATALKEWEDLMPKDKRTYGSFENYYATINNTAGGGGGTDLSAQAAAILASRNK